MQAGNGVGAAGQHHALCCSMTSRVTVNRQQRTQNNQPVNPASLPCGGGGAPTAPSSAATWPPLEPAAAAAAPACRVQYKLSAGDHEGERVLATSSRGSWLSSKQMLPPPTPAARLSPKHNAAATSSHCNAPFCLTVWSSAATSRSPLVGATAAQCHSLCNALFCLGVGGGLRCHLPAQSLQLLLKACSFVPGKVLLDAFASRQCPLANRSCTRNNAHLRCQSAAPRSVPAGRGPAPTPPAGAASPQTCGSMGAAVQLGNQRQGCGCVAMVIQHQAIALEGQLYQHDDAHAQKGTEGQEAHNTHYSFAS